MSASLLFEERDLRLLPPFGATSLSLYHRLGIFIFSLPFFVLVDCGVLHYRRRLP